MKTGKNAEYILIFIIIFYLGFGKPVLQLPAGADVEDGFVVCANIYVRQFTEMTVMCKTKINGKK